MLNFKVRVGNSGDLKGRINLKRILLALGIGVFIGGCATPYQKAGFGGGFTEIQLSQNVWQIYFRGNGQTTLKKATDFCLLRSAELTLENGYKYFTVTDKDSKIESSTFTSKVHVFSDGTTMGGERVTVHRPRTQNTILMHHEKSGNRGIVYEAELVVRSLANSYSIDSIQSNLLQKEKKLREQRELAAREQELEEREREVERLRRQREIAAREQELEERDRPVPPIQSAYSGTGFMFSSKDYVITNWHVLRGTENIKVKFLNGENIKATVVLKDPQNDIAFLKLEQSPQLPVSDIRIGDSSEMRMGDEVFTIGYPAYWILGKNPKYTKGEVNALSGINDDPRVFQISVQIQPGNSGGPLFNSRGEVIGITQASLDPKVAIGAFGALPQNVNYAIKSSYISSLLPMLPQTLIASRGIVIVPAEPENTLANFIEKAKKNIVLIEAKE